MTNERQLSATIEEYKSSKYKKTVPLFLFPESQMHENKSFRFHFVETIFKMKLNTFGTKYTDTLTFNFAHNIIYPRWSIMSLSHEVITVMAPCTKIIMFIIYSYV